MRHDGSAVADRPDLAPNGSPRGTQDDAYAGDGLRPLVTGLLVGASVYLHSSDARHTALKRGMTFSANRR
jgi:hypothetical protein